MEIASKFINADPLILIIMALMVIAVIRIYLNTKRR